MFLHDTIHNGSCAYSIFKDLDNHQMSILGFNFSLCLVIKERKGRKLLILE